MVICTAMIFPVQIIEYLLLFIAAICDVKYRKIYDWLIVLLMINSFFSPFDILQRMAAFFVSLIFLFPLAMLFSALKGGDMKYILVLGAFFGIYKLSRILCVSLILGFIFCFIKREKSFPLAFVAFVSVLIIEFMEVLL